MLKETKTVYNLVCLMSEKIQPHKTLKSIAYSFFIKSYIVRSNNLTIVISRNLYMPKVETQFSRLNKCNIYMYMSYVNLLVNSALVY